MKVFILKNKNVYVYVYIWLCVCVCVYGSFSGLLINQTLRNFRRSIHSPCDFKGLRFRTMSAHPPASFGPQRTEQQDRAGLLHPTLSPGHSLRSGLSQTDARKMFCILFPTEQCFFSFPTKGIFHHKKQSTCELMRQERRT